MMEEKQQIFTAFMDEFVLLTTEQKNHEIVEKQILILTLLQKFANEHGIEFQFLRSNEIYDITDNNGTNEDYLEAIMVYTHNIEELIGLILQNLK